MFVEICTSGFLHCTLHRLLIGAKGRNIHIFITYLQNCAFLKMISFFTLFIYLFYDNLATGGSLTCAILSCHVELSKYSTTKFRKKTNNTQNEYTALLESITKFQKFVNSVKNSY